MNSLFTEITDSEATSVVGGLFVLPSSGFRSVNAFAGSKAKATTEFQDTGWTRTYATADTIQTDYASEAEAVSESQVFYTSDPL